MKKLITIFLSIALIIIIDYAIPYYYPLRNNNEYLLGFEKFHQNAKQTLGQNRIILVGGSSLGWGVSAEVLSQNLGTLTLNSGISANLGYKLFFRNISDVIDIQRDIFVVSPEYHIVSQNDGLGRSEDFCIISLYVRREYPIDCVGYSLSSLVKLRSIWTSIKSITFENEYIRGGFNKFGDYVHRIDGINMVGKMEDSDICSGWEIQHLTEKYIPFTDGLVSKGYEIVYIPNFSPTVACKNPKKIIDFHDIIFDRYGVQTFQEAKLLFDEEFFYNSEYHVTKVGASLRTNIFESQLRHYLKTR
jgi:hypothetical protein